MSQESQPSSEKSRDAQESSYQPKTPEELDGLSAAGGTNPIPAPRSPDNGGIRPHFEGVDHKN